MSDTSMTVAWPVQSASRSHLAGIVGSRAINLEAIRVFPSATEMSAMAGMSGVALFSDDVLGTGGASTVFATAYRVWLEGELGPRSMFTSEDSESSIIQGWGKSSWQEQLAAEIGAYTLRGPGWDGYSAKAIDHSAVADAMAFVRQLPDDLPQPLDQPCSDGEVSLVWRRGECFAEIGFAGVGTFWWYGTDGEREDSGEDLPVNHGIPTALSRIMGFLAEERASNEAPWGRLFLSEWTFEQGFESSHAPPAYVHPMAVVRFRAAA